MKVNNLYKMIHVAHALDELGYAKESDILVSTASKICQAATASEALESALNSASNAAERAAVQERINQGGDAQDALNVLNRLREQSEVNSPPNIDETPALVPNQLTSTVPPSSGSNSTTSPNWYARNKGWALPVGAAAGVAGLSALQHKNNENNNIPGANASPTTPSGTPDATSDVSTTPDGSASPNMAANPGNTTVPGPQSSTQPQDRLNDYMGYGYSAYKNISSRNDTHHGLNQARNVMQHYMQQNGENPQFIQQVLQKWDSVYTGQQHYQQDK